jgi:hypothetical protein
MNNNRLALALSCLTALLGCSESVDSRSDGLPVYQSGAAPVSPWKLVDDGAGEGEEPIAPGNNGVTNGMQGGAGAAATGTGGTTGAMVTGSGGMASSMATGTGGMTAGMSTGTGGKTGGTGGMGTSTGTGGMDMGTGGSTETTGAMPTMVTFDVTTLSQGGRYEPQNIGAIWVEDSSGKYVKTLEVWAGIRAIYLQRWLSVNAWGDQTDAVTSATLRMQKPHHATWDLTDSSGKAVPDGDYSIYVESTDQDFAGDNTSIKFTKGPKAAVVMPPDEASFKSLKLAYQ